ncbi:uncharacterized protein DI49_0421 [Saccharomyces eubayanus]|uniref:uncharacterized protein n=1 Tax=Saccharomyces eubayanus TaxID=1080349 RepID=UPI0006C05C30|nr:hypothetical protein DI49_0421 [Saccharomyces eubayanus]KOH01073.1 hypothetical protein DI49_0421 [Saccharomyces eubayanus]
MREVICIETVHRNQKILHLIPKKTLMFDSFNSGKNRRRSFFRFGSESKNSDFEQSVRKLSTPPATRKSTSNTPPSRDKTITPDVPPRSPHRNVHARSRSIQAPLEKGPLKNTNPFLNAGTNTSDSFQSLKFKEVPMDDFKENQKSATNNITKKNTSPFTTSTNLNVNLSSLKRPRPPPPPVDMKSITSSLSNSTIKEDTSMDNDYEQNIISPPSRNQHRRQRSEAEKLVDDIEDYIIEHNGNPDSPISANAASLSDVETAQDVPVNSLSIPILRDVSIESSLSYVKPLVVGGGVVNGHSDTKDLKLEHPVQLSSNVDDGNDRFSFTTSVSGKSTRSLQQVVKDESNGFKSAHSDFVYKSIDHLKSDESIGSARRPLRITNEADSGSSDEEQNDYQDKYSFGEEKSNTSTSTEDHQGLRIKNDVPTQEPELATHRRVFRVVNEDRPSFFLNSAEDTGSLIDGHSLDTATSSGEYGMPLNVANPSEPSISKSAQSNVLSTLDSSGDTKSSNKTSELNSSNSISESLVLAPQSLNEDTISAEEATGFPSSAPTVPNEKSVKGSTLTSVVSNKSEKSVPLVSSYVEELRLKYYRTSNFLQAPPNLPVALKQKNNLIQPRNIKVKLRTSSKQIGIKHGKVKQKLLALETRNEDSNERSNGSDSKNNINVDHTKEFHKLLEKETGVDSTSKSGNAGEDQAEDYLKDIPGDEAYNSDDIMAPLREKKGQTDSADSVTRSNTVVSYYTRSQNRMRSGTLDNDYVNRQKLPTHICLQDYRDSNAKNDVTRQDSVSTTDSEVIEPSYSLGRGLRVANPDSDAE